VNLASNKKDAKDCRQLADDFRRYEKRSSGYRLAITTRLGSSIMSLDQSVAKDARSEPRQDGPLDKKKALVERLSKVILDLSEDSITSLNDNTVEAINFEVDRIESLLGKDERDTTHNEDGKGFKDPETFVNIGDDASSSPSTPTKELQQPSMPVFPVANPTTCSEPDITGPQAIKIANEAEQLASQLAASIQELQRRREEFDVRPSKHTILKSELTRYTAYPRPSHLTAREGS
jgi:hypothetical protein